MSVFITIALIWILIGALLWMFNDPIKAIDVTNRTYLARNKRLAPTAMHVAATGLIIVAWPMVAWMMLAGLRAGFMARRGLRG